MVVLVRYAVGDGFWALVRGEIHVWYKRRRKTGKGGQSWEREVRWGEEIIQEGNIGSFDGLNLATGSPGYPLHFVHPSGAGGAVGGRRPRSRRTDGEEMMRRNRPEIRLKTKRREIEHWIGSPIATLWIHAQAAASKNNKLGSLECIELILRKISLSVIDLTSAPNVKPSTLRHEEEKIQNTRVDLYLYPCRIFRIFGVFFVNSKQLA